MGGISFFTLFFGFVFGIVFGVNLGASVFIGYFFLFLGSILFLFFLERNIFIKDKLNKSFHIQSFILIASVFVLTFSVGFLRANMVLKKSQILTERAKIITTKNFVVGRVISDPKKRFDKTEFIILPLKINNAPKILVKTNYSKTVSYGDILKINGKFYFPKRSDLFDYKKYLQKDNVFLITSYPKIMILHKNHNSFLGALFKIKHFFVRVMDKYLPAKEAALAGGITVGVKSGLTKELQEKFRDTGIIHIIVLSGYNVAIIATFLLFLFSFLPKYVANIVSVFAIALFVVFVGAEAPIARAGLMAIIGILGAISGKYYSALRALLFTGVVFVFINPYILFYDVSFQLSFIATLGMILGIPILEKTFSFLPNFAELRLIVSATIATQIAVLPLIMFYMGKISIVGVFVNLLVVPIVPFAMLGAFLLFIASFFGGWFAWIISITEYFLLEYIFMVVDIFARSPFATVEIGFFGIYFLLFYYIVIFALLLKYGDKKLRESI